MATPYVRLGFTLVLSWLVMFLLSMSMVRTLDHYILNLSNLYIATVMVSAMGVLMLLTMWHMFPARRVNVALLVGFAALFLGALTLGRNEAFVGDEQFLRSMIPHHSRAILVCQESDLVDPEIIELCGQIVEAQQREIDQMQEMLRRFQGT